MLPLTDAAVAVHSCLTFAAYLQCTSFAVNNVSIFANWYRIFVGAVHLKVKAYKSHQMAAF